MPPNKSKNKISNPNNIRLSSIPARLNPSSSKHSRLNTPSTTAEPSPLLSASSYGSQVDNYIGSDADTTGGRTPGLDSRLFAPAPPEEDSSAPTDLHGHDDRYQTRPADLDYIDSSDDEDDDMSAYNSASYHHSNRGDGRPVSPLLKNSDHDRGRPRYSHSGPASPVATPSASTPSGDLPHMFNRRSTLRSRSPDTQARMAARKRYTFAAIFLVVSLISFCVQAELGRYVQHELGWNKAYCMLYLTHGSWVILWPAQLAILRLQQRSVPWPTFWRRHVYLLRSTAHMVAEQDLDVPRHILQQRSPLPYLLRTTAFITSALTVAGLSWYVAVSMTSPSDLTAIYNCSAFFAYAFSVPLLKEKLRLDKSIAVLIAIVGVLVVAYGDSKEEAEGDAAAAATAEAEAGMRFLGNMIIGAGSVLYGLYEVLYKRYACPPEGTSPTRGMIFANAFGSCIGLFTLLVLWVPIPLLHFLGWELFELPGPRAAFYLLVSVVMNATFAGSFLVLISLTSPVLSSVAALLTIFIVAVADWLITGEAMSAAAVAGGCMIIVAFLMLSWSTWREMTEEGSATAAAAAAAAGHGKASGGDYEPAEVVDWSSEDEDEDEDEDEGINHNRK